MELDNKYLSRGTVSGITTTPGNPKLYLLLEVVHYVQSDQQEHRGSQSHIGRYVHQDSALRMLTGLRLIYRG